MSRLFESILHDFGKCVHVFNEGSWSYSKDNFRHLSIEERYVKFILKIEGYEINY